MSQRIDDVLAVLRELRRLVRAPGIGPVREARIRVIRGIAEHRGVTPQTIADAYLRRLRPAVADTAAFDHLVRRWLAGEPDALRVALLSVCLDNGDRRAVAELIAGRLSGPAAQPKTAAALEATWLDLVPEEPKSQSIVPIYTPMGGQPKYRRRPRRRP